MKKVIQIIKKMTPSSFKERVKSIIYGRENHTIISGSCFDTNKVTTLIKGMPVDRSWEAFEKDCRCPKNSDIEKNLLIHTHRVSFELSNLCNYAKIHRKCPLSLITEPEILPAKIVFHVLDFLSEHNFSGKIAFHNYSEPLIDPRLFKLIEYAHKACPDSSIYICTNGYYLNQTLADELVATGVSSIHVSAYSKGELNRLSKIHLNITFEVELMRLDDRLKVVYEGSKLHSTKPCFAPLNEIVIASSGLMLLCCLDWRRLYSFGNLQEQSLEEILRSGKLQAAYERLSKGDRFLGICKRCSWTR